MTLAPAATLNLNFAGTQTVRGLFVGDAQMAAGIYGTNDVSGDIVISQITGSGKLEVVGLPPSGTVLMIR